MQREGFSLARHWEAFGNGDSKKGRLLLEAITSRLEHAREKHSWGSTGEISNAVSAEGAIEGEIMEWKHACLVETPERQFDEALDIIAVATRIANREYRD